MKRSEPLGDQLRSREGFFCITVAFVAASISSRMPQFVCENPSEGSAVQHGACTGRLPIRLLCDERSDRVAFHFAERKQRIAGGAGDTQDFGNGAQASSERGKGASPGEFDHHHLLKFVGRRDVGAKPPLQFETFAGDKSLRFFFHLRSNLTGWSGFELEHYGEGGRACGKHRKRADNDQAKSVAHVSLGRRSSRLII